MRRLLRPGPETIVLKWAEISRRALKNGDSKSLKLKGAASAAWLFETGGVSTAAGLSEIPAAFFRRRLFFVLIDIYESLQRAVIGFFDVVGEKAGRKLPVAPVVGETFAAHALAFAGFPGTVASFKILLSPAFVHKASCEFDIGKSKRIKIIRQGSGAIIPLSVYPGQSVSAMNLIPQTRLFFFLPAGHNLYLFHSRHNGVPLSGRQSRSVRFR